MLNVLKNTIILLLSYHISSLGSFTISSRSKYKIDETDKYKVFSTKKSYEIDRQSAELEFKAKAEYIKRRLLLSEFVRDEYNIELLQVDYHRYKCKCCFHKDNNPSLIITDYVESTGGPVSLYNCFACGVSGYYYDDN